MKGIIDTTLREGAQTVGVCFSLTQKLDIVKGLCRIGIEEIELGIATRLDSDLEKLLTESRKLCKKTVFSLWSRCNKSDIAFAASLKPDILSLSIPVSDLHIAKKLQKSRKWVVETVKESLLYAKKRNK